MEQKTWDLEVGAENKAKEEKPSSKEPVKSDYKQEKEKTLKLNFDDETNWNYLFMNQDTVAASMAKQLNQSKGEYLDRDQKSSMAVKMAKAETIIINQTKEWLQQQKVIDFDALDRNPRASCTRSDTVILIKNIPATAKEAELKELFERYGSLKRFMVSPFNTLAIAEYSDTTQAHSAMKNLAYHKVNFLTPIYLEMAPTGFFKVKAAKKAGKSGDGENPEEGEKEAVAGDETIT